MRLREAAASPAEFEIYAAMLREAVEAAEAGAAPGEGAAP